MKYFIYRNDKPHEVSQDDYEERALLEIENFQLPDYLAVISGRIYSIESTYQRVIDDEDCDPPMPFVLFFLEDFIGLQEDGLKYFDNKENIEFFETFNEIRLRRNELVELIQELI